MFSALFTVPMMKNCFYAENADVFPGVIARSKTVQDYEKFIQKTIYPYIIHPYSKFRVYWEIAMLFVIFCQLTLFFPIWLFFKHSSITYQLFLNVISSSCLFDIVLKFFTGYVEEGTEIVVLDQRRIIRRYLLKSFIFDFLSCLPVEAITCVVCRDFKIIAITPWEVSRLHNLVVFTPAVQTYFRTFSSMRYLKNTSRVMFWNPLIHRLLIILSCFIIIMNLNLLVMLLYIHLNGMKVNEMSWKDFYLFATFLIDIPISFLFDFNAFGGWVVLLRFPIKILGFFCTVYLTAYFIKFVRYSMRTKERFYILDSNVRIFMRKNRLPSSLRQKTLLYYKVFIKSNRYKEDEISYYFPETFKSEVFSQLALSLLKGFYAFEELPIYVLRRLAECLKYQLYLPNEVVMMRGETKLSLYFIQNGTVALYTTNNTELYHFEDGASFNGKHFVEGSVPKHHYAISLEVSEIYKLYHEDFLRIMASYPKLLGRMKEMLYKNIIDEEI